MTKKIIILAGPNGAGKATFARSFSPLEAQCQRFINANLTAAGLSPFAPEAAALKAGLRNLEQAYKPAVDSWAEYDNVGEEPTLLQWGGNP